MNKDTRFYYSQRVPKILYEQDRLRISRQIMGVLKVHLGDTKELTCLDVGCSSGIITKYLGKFFKKIVGIDVDKYAISVASKNTAENIELKVMSAQKMDIPDNTFDVVILNQVYEFVGNQKDLVDEVYRVLKPNGICFVGARNKLSIIEGQTGLPLVHFLPNRLAQYVTMVLKREYYPPKYLSIWEINKLFYKFHIMNITADIINKPDKYNFTGLLKYRPILIFVPKIIVESLMFLIPNYILLCKKD